MHYHRHDITGKLYKITMRWTQLELGFPDPFYKYKYEKCKNYITSTIITDLWEYISLCNATLREQQPWTYTPPRHNDFFLNYVVFRSNIPNEHKQIFNEVRIHLHLINASDIVSLNSGTRILPNIINGFNNRGSSLQWPNTLPFPLEWIKIWKNIVITIIQPILQTSPLEAWTSQTHQVWHTTISCSHTILHANNKYHSLTKSSRRAKYEPTAQQLPCDLNVDVIYHKTILILLHQDNPLHQHLSRYLQPLRGIFLRCTIVATAKLGNSPNYKSHPRPNFHRITKR